MLISGIEQFTLVDYPEKTACIIFTPGCNFRCGYCHNPEFVLPEKIIQLKNSFIPETAVFNFLNERRGFLDGVVISGGEPTIMPDLIPFMDTIKSLGYLVKLDTNGNRPDVLRQAVTSGVVDYVAMDIKTSLAEYPSLVGPAVNPEAIQKSIEFLKAGNLDYEFRCTLIKEIHPDHILEDMARLMDRAKQVFLQSFRSTITLKPSFKSFHAFSEQEMKVLAHTFLQYAQKVSLRLA